MHPVHIYAQITRLREAELAAGAARRPHELQPSQRTTAVRAPFAIRLLRRSAGAAA